MSGEDLQALALVQSCKLLFADEKLFGTFPHNLEMLGLRYALGLGRAFDMQDSKRSIRPRAPVWYRPKALRCLSKYGFGKIELQINRQYVSFDVRLWTSIVGLSRVPRGEVALIGRSVGMVSNQGGAYATNKHLQPKPHQSNLKADKGGRWGSTPNPTILGRMTDARTSAIKFAFLRT
ncbi:unnamed protein product [Prunus armeniaca]